MSELTEIAVPVFVADAGHAAVAAVAAALEPWTIGGAVVELSGFGAYGESDRVQVVVRGYLRHPAAAPDALASLEQQLRLLPQARLVGEARMQALAERDWAEAWRQHYHPLRLGQRLLISPTWETPALQPGDCLVWLDPGMAFGTGAHPSTQLILRLLEQFLRPSHHVLDVGTGSGILAIAALKLGAAHAYATDIDPLAVAAAAANAQTNQVEDRLTLAAESLPTQGQYDLICANILADVIADLFLQQGLAERLAPAGVVLLSGIIAPRRHLVDLALAACGLATVACERDGDWLALAARPSP